jgi:hypothetical protein
MRDKNSAQSDSEENITQKQLERLIVLIETSLIIDLAMMGIGQQEIRKMVNCDMRRITKLLKPIKDKIKESLKETK